jgi:hypothetical protein
MTRVPAIEGAHAIVAWFGNWPRFHDHYLLSVPSEPGDDGVMRIHAWVTDWKTTDDSGHFVRDRDCVVIFELTRIQRVQLSEPTLPSIIFDLTLAHDASGWTITWDSSYGAAGEVKSGTLRVRLEPGKPRENESA